MASSDLKGDMGDWFNSRIQELNDIIENYESTDWAVTSKDEFIGQRQALLDARAEFWDILQR